MIQFKVQKKYYDDIKNGIKTCEGRIAKSKYRNINPGDKVMFCPNDSSESLSATVISLHIYKSFSAMLTNEKVSQMLPGIDSVDEGVQIYSSFGNYKDEVKEFGCISIRIEIDK